MMIKLGKIKETKHYTIYKVADTDLINEAFKEYRKTNKLSKLTKDDKIKCLKQLGYSDDEINIILQYIQKES